MDQYDKEIIIVILFAIIIGVLFCVGLDNWMQHQKNDCISDCNSLGKEYFSYSVITIFNDDECWCLKNNETMRIR